VTNGKVEQEITEKLRMQENFNYYLVIHSGNGKGQR
jgi:hypothetical protein